VNGERGIDATSETITHVSTVATVGIHEATVDRLGGSVSERDRIAGRGDLMVPQSMSGLPAPFGPLEASAPGSSAIHISRLA